MTDTPPKISFVKALEQLGLTERFRRFCAPAVRDATVHRWVQANPKLCALGHVPKTFKDVRRQLGCTAKPGGLRPGKKPRGYSVRGL